MFTKILNTDFLDNIQKKALTIIKQDRDKYKAIYDIILKYCSDQNIIISNYYVLTNQEDTMANVIDKVYKCYTIEPFRHANNLTNLIHQNKADKYQYTRLNTIVEHEEFSIMYDTRVVVQIYGLQKHRSTDFMSIIKPTKIDKCLYMPAEIELIDVYHNFYNNKIDDLAIETELYKQVYERKEKGIIGSGVSCKERKKEIIEVIKIGLVKDWILKKCAIDNIILIGPWAHDWIKHGKNICVNLEKIQIISSTSVKELLAELRHYLSEFNMTVTYREQELHIPKDFRTVRYTFYLQDKPFLDLFNCAEFEIIPYHNINGIFIASKWVILRFLFIDLWIIRVIKSLGLLSQDVLNKKIIYLWDLIEYFREKEKELSKDTENYIGVFIDYIIDKKISNLQEKRFEPYVPEIYLKKNNKYREIQ